MIAHRRQHGFTLVELLIVVLIIGILVAIAMPVYIGVKQTAAKRACFASERTVEGAFAAYEASSGPGPAMAIANWDQLMDRLVPSYLASAPPICPGKGVYSWTYRTVRCSAHGSYGD